MQSRSALSALAMTRRQKCSMAPWVWWWRLSHWPRVSVDVRIDRAHHRPEGAHERELVRCAECFCAEQLRQPMQRRGQARRAEKRAAAAGLDHRHLAGPVNLIVDADALVEADEIGAAAEEHMLAVIDDFVDAGMQVGACAATKIAAALDELDTKAGIGQRAGSTHAGDAAADDRDRAVLFRVQAVCLPCQFITRAHATRSMPTARMASFCSMGTLTRDVKTS